MSGLWNKGYDVLCLIARTLYNLLRHEKNITKKLRKSLEVMFYSTTFAPAFERERRFRNDGNVEVSLGRGWGWLGQAIISNRPEIGLRKKLENFSPKNLEVKKKSLPLQPQSRNDSDKSSLRDLHNSTSSTSIGKLIFRIDTVKEVWLWTTITDSGARI